MQIPLRHATVAHDGGTSAIDQPVEVYGLVLTSGSAAATAEIYDANSISGTPITIKSVSAGSTPVVFGGGFIPFVTGVYVVLTGAAAKLEILYK